MNPETNNTHSVNPHTLGGGFNSTLGYSNPEKVDVQVHVLDEEDDPVGQVEVSIDDISCTTGNAGGCTLRNVPTGECTITAVKEGYAPYSQTV